jgi:hypothetical protein
MISQNIIEILNILLSQKPQIPLNRCVSYLLADIARNKSLVLKTFTHLTDVLNNPEHGELN